MSPIPEFGELRQLSQEGGDLREDRLAKIMRLRPRRIREGERMGIALTNKFPLERVDGAVIPHNGSSILDILTEEINKTDGIANPLLAKFRIGGISRSKVEIKGERRILGAHLRIIDRRGRSVFMYPGDVSLPEVALAEVAIIPLPYLSTWLISKEGAPMCVIAEEDSFSWVNLELNPSKFPKHGFSVYPLRWMPDPRKDYLFILRPSHIMC